MAGLEKWMVDMAGLHEMKWFGSGMFRVAESVAITSGRDVLAGLGLVLGQ